MDFKKMAALADAFAKFELLVVHDPINYAKYSIISDVLEKMA